MNERCEFDKHRPDEESVALITCQFDVSDLRNNKKAFVLIACLPAIPIQIHWGNLGSAAAGLAALTATLFAVVYALVKRQGPAWLQDVRSREQAQAQAARDQGGLAREEAEQIRLDRRRHLYGWSRGSLTTFGLVLVTSESEVTRASRELNFGGPSAYVILRVTEGPGDENRALHLRQIIEREGYISRQPTAGEREALEAGLPVVLNSESD